VACCNVAADVCVSCAADVSCACVCDVRVCVSVMRMYGERKYTYDLIQVRSKVF